VRARSALPARTTTSDDTAGIVIREFNQPVGGHLRAMTRGGVDCLDVRQSDLVVEHLRPCENKSASSPNQVFAGSPVALSQSRPTVGLRHSYGKTGANVERRIPAPHFPCASPLRALGKDSRTPSLVCVCSRTFCIATGERCEGSRLARELPTRAGGRQAARRREGVYTGKCSS